MKGAEREGEETQTQTQTEGKVIAQAKERQVKKQPAMCNVM